MGMDSGWEELFSKAQAFTVVGTKIEFFTNGKPVLVRFGNENELFRFLESWSKNKKPAGASMLNPPPLPQVRNYPR